MIRMKCTEFDDYWLPLLSGQGSDGSYVRALEPALRDSVRDAVRLAFMSGDPRAEITDCDGMACYRHG